MTETRRFTRTTPAALGGGPDKVEHFETFPLELTSDLREGDDLRGTWSARHPLAGQSGLPFAEAGGGWLLDPVVTRPASPVPNERGVFGTVSPFGSPHRVNAMTVERDGLILLVAANGTEYLPDQVTDFRRLPNPDHAEGRIW